MKNKSVQFRLNKVRQELSDLNPRQRVWIRKFFCFKLL